MPSSRSASPIGRTAELEPRVSFVTLGVDDVGRSRRNSTRRWDSRRRPRARTRLHSSMRAELYSRSSAVTLWRRTSAYVASQPGFSGISLAHNVNSESEVDQVLGEAVAAGAKLLKPGQKAFWGGYSGYFADPDGHLWEVAYNPFMPLDAQRPRYTSGTRSMSIDGLSDDDIRAILTRVKTFAVVGASAKAGAPELLRHALPHRPGLYRQADQSRHCGQDDPRPDGLCRPCRRAGAGRCRRRLSRVRKP